MVHSVLYRDGRRLAFLVVALLVAAPLVAQETGSGRGTRVGQTFLLSQTSGERSFLGVGVREIDAERAREKKLSEEHGVEITKVNGDSAAEKAGLQKGDVVMEYNGQRVEGVEQFVRLVRETPIGRTVVLRVNRDGRPQNLEVTMGSCQNCGLLGLGTGVAPQVGRWFEDLGRNSGELVLPDVPRVFTTWRSSMLGIEAEGLQSQLAHFFGVEKGVLVRSVVEDSAAERAGFRAGDVILRVAGEEVSTPREVSSEIRRHRGESFDVLIIRDRKEVSLTVTVDDGRGDGGRSEGLPLQGARQTHL